MQNTMTASTDRLPYNVEEPLNITLTDCKYFKWKYAKHDDLTTLT